MTRAVSATYRFGTEDASLRPTLYLYNPKGGDPIGSLKKLAGCRTAETFLRRNGTAEITWLHISHGDTDWRYDITCEGPETRYTAHKRLKAGYGKSDWKVSEFENWAAFEAWAMEVE